MAYTEEQIDNIIDSKKSKIEVLVKRSLYQCYTNATGIIYVVATDPTSAQKAVEEKLNKSDYGFSKDRIVTQIKIIGKELEKRFNGEGYSFSKNETNLIL